mmetsp:Transcript_18384/g.46572  ORF Transcript_18384/g.46572 Transcript_18384/m.46572 type:complete len:266 (+) Transcript_18384:1495-2292(+)
MFLIEASVCTVVGPPGWLSMTLGGTSFGRMDAPSTENSVMGGQIFSLNMKVRRLLPLAVGVTLASTLSNRPDWSRVRRSSDSSARLHLKPDWHLRPAKSSSAVGMPCPMGRPSATISLQKNSLELVAEYSSSSSPSPAALVAVPASNSSNSSSSTYSSMISSSKSLGCRSARSWIAGPQGPPSPPPPSPPPPPPPHRPPPPPPIAADSTGTGSAMASAALGSHRPRQKPASAAPKLLQSGCERAGPWPPEAASVSGRRAVLRREG